MSPETPILAALRDQIAVLRAERERAAAQRDALLAACKAAREKLLWAGYSKSQGGIVAKLTAVIANAEGQEG